MFHRIVRCVLVLVMVWCLGAERALAQPGNDPQPVPTVPTRRRTNPIQPGTPGQPVRKPTPTSPTQPRPIRRVGPGEVGGGSLSPTRLRCEYLVEPLAVECLHPRLSWELETSVKGARDLRQTAYQIEVLPLGGAGADEHRPLWDTGKVESAATCQIEYQGAAVRSRERVSWRVRVWDQNGKASEWSAPASWGAGLLAQGDWGGAQWIGDATPAPEGVGPIPAPMLRKGFDAGSERPRRAMVYVTALGLYELSINGRRVGDHELAPEWTDYKTRVQYQAFDVTNLVEHGANAIGAVLGDGWYAGKIGLTGIVPNGPKRAIYGRKPRLLLRLELTYADGHSTSIVSDGSWKSTLDGPIRADDLLDGETYDARKEMPGWNTKDFDDKGWKAAEVAAWPAIAVVAQTNEPIRVLREVAAVSVSEPKPGVYVFDLGQNMVGRCRVKMEGKAGQTITLRHAEMLNKDGTIYTENLRGAAQTDRYTFKGQGSEIFEPAFTYHGFRYVEVTGLDRKPELGAVAGEVANSSAAEVGTFECSDAMVSRLWQNILWTQRGNLMGVPTDCPQRDERCGWMGDILAFAPTACFNMDMAAFFTKWIPDTRDAQTKDGRFADFSPDPYEPQKRFSGVPAWGDAGVFVPWQAYQAYGDERILADQYDAAVRWVEWIHTWNPDLLWANSRGNDYGDWLNADTLKLEGWPAKGAEVPKDVFATMYFYRSTQIVCEMARVLHKAADAEKYASLASAIKDAFVKAYVSADGTIKGDTQAGYALALHFGLVPESLRDAATKKMIDRFVPYGWQISTGFHSTLPLMEELSSRGHNVEAYGLLLNRKMPSWGYEVDHGATTVWERWDGWVEGRGFQDPGMNSFAHYAIGSVGQWMYETMLGIRADAPGFASVVIHPRPGPGVQWAKGSYHSIRGTISCGWEQNQGETIVRVTIPPNVTAQVFIPGEQASRMTVDGVPLERGRGVKVEGVKDHAVVCRVGSGSYTFSVKH